MQGWVVRQGCDGTNESGAHNMAENCAKGVMEKMRVVLIPWLRTAPRV